MKIVDFTIQDHHVKIVEGEVVGIVLGWIFGGIGIYLIGLLIIFKFCKNGSIDDESNA